MMNFYKKRIGIWGFGIVGKSVLTHLTRQGAYATVFDKRSLTDDEKELLTKHQATYYQSDEFESFCYNQDYIIPSPGIDIRAHRHLPLITEVDIFSSQFYKPIIAITGTLGKTSTTQLLAHVLSNNALKIAMGGNVGIGMLDLIDQGTDYDYALLELSSFQLELSEQFSPLISLWTNFYPNHLDRHITLKEYFDAKQKIFEYQQPGSYVILPLEIMDKLSVQCQGTRIFFTAQPITNSAFQQLQSTDQLFFVQGKDLIHYVSGSLQRIMSTDDLPHITFISNEIAIAALLHLLHIPIERLTHARLTFKLEEHRLEKIRTINDIDYYNDSKATISQATLAAVEKLQGKPIILLLGGLSKGVDRSVFIPLFRNKVSHIICFGKEALLLSQAASIAGVPTSSFETLEQACEYSRKIARPGDQVLFSPAGSSFDLFKNYQERGAAFKKIILGL